MRPCEIVACRYTCDPCPYRHSGNLIETRTYTAFGGLFASALPPVKKQNLHLLAPVNRAVALKDEKDEGRRERTAGCLAWSYVYARNGPMKWHESVKSKAGPPGRTFGPTTLWHSAGRYDSVARAMGVLPVKSLVERSESNTGSAAVASKLRPVWRWAESEGPCGPASRCDRAGPCHLSRT